MLEEKLGYRRYDIEPIVEKFYSRLERELKKFGETDDEDRAQKFDDYIKREFAHPYDKEDDESDCLYIGTFEGTDYNVNIYIVWFLDSVRGTFVEELSDLDKRECVVLLNDIYIKNFVNLTVLPFFSLYFFKVLTITFESFLSHILRMVSLKD